MAKKIEKEPEVTQEDLEARIKGFNAELLPLLGKYKLGLSARPLLTNDGRFVAQPFLFDDSKKPEPTAEEKVEKKSELESA